MQKSSTQTMCESATSDSDEGTLTGLSQELLTCFQGFLAAYTDHTQTSQDSEQEKLLDEFGRFRIWAAQTGAALHGRDSLDVDLQNDPQLRNSIIEVLQQIIELLRLGPSEDVLTSDSEYSEGDADICNEGSAHPRPKITRATYAAEILVPASMDPRGAIKKDFVPVIDTSHKTLSLPAPSENLSQSTLPTVRTFSSVARSDIFENSSEVRPERTEYANSEGDGYDGTLRVPNVPVDSKKATTFECPYCHTTLESSQMRERNTWKRHVFRDLRPYTCTFSDCSNPDKLYATRRDWVYHEMQMHRRLWSCTLCSYKSTVRQDFAAHLLESHERECQPNQVPLLLETSHGSLEESASQECIFCHKQTSLRRLMNHVAGHLEILALFVLHAAPDDTTEESSSAELSPLNSEDDDIWQYAEPIPLEEAVDVSKPEFTCDPCNRTFDQAHKLKYFTGFLKQKPSKANLSL
ncbi:hypothetical protein PG996_014550 [Apiospora saccharicola]|uniref:C2H2-type domain-containing protein n=1 Tax=Apiospora saccharicola TaxID=335842 RepID=A0ABR1TIM6_9PEZI